MTLQATEDSGSVATEVSVDSPLQEVYEFADEEISAQRKSQFVPADTCPLIDKLVKHLQQMQKDCDYISRRGETVEEYQSTIDTLRGKLEDIESEMESLREANSALRDLGKEWYNVATTIFKEIERKANEPASKE